MKKTISVFETEVEDLRWVILKITNLGNYNVIFKSDAKRVVDAITCEVKKDFSAPHSRH